MKKKVVLFIFIVLISAISFYTFNQIIPGINLHKTILNALSGARGKYSVVVKDLKSEKGESLYGDKVYDIGSLYKLWVMAEVFEQIQNDRGINPARHPDDDFAVIASPPWANAAISSSSKFYLKN